MEGKPFTITKNCPSLHFPDTCADCHEKHSVLLAKSSWQPWQHLKNQSLLTQKTKNRGNRLAIP